MVHEHNVWTRMFQTVNVVVQVLLVFICIYPFYYIMIYSLSTPQAAARGVTLLPKQFTLLNYSKIFALNDIYGAFLISVARTVSGTLVTVLCCSLFAYLITKKELYFRRTIYRFLVVTMYFNAGLIPWYLSMKWLGLQNNFLLYILPSALAGFYVILLKTFIEQLPAALEESAMIDGAGYLTVFRSVIFPLSMPIVATIAVFAAVGQWNTWMDNYFLVGKPGMQTLQLILYQYLSDAQRLSRISTTDMSNLKTRVTPESIKMTITMIVTLPILFVYPFLQRYFVKGIMLGAVKG